MFVYGKDCRVEDLGNGVTRRILAHDGAMMQVELVNDGPVTIVLDSRARE